MRQGPDQLRQPEEVVVPLEKPFDDDRGSIQNLIEADVRMAVVIHFKAGCIRASHCHKTDWHYCCVLQGENEHFHRPGGSNSPAEGIVVRSGQFFFTPPMVGHAMRFPKETVFLALSRNPRDHASYEADVDRVPGLAS
jgi:quercetin dioxygenase-like cupin family protein